MTMQINGTSGLVFNDASTQNTAATGFGFKNRLINGNMAIAQRGTGSVTNDAAQNLFPVDRFGIYGDVSSKFTAQQNAGSVTPPAGYTNYLGITSSSAYSVLSSGLNCVFQLVEGFNSADLGWGTANAQTVTLSFWVRSSLTGTFGGSILNSAFDRSYPFSYTITAANTWEQKTVTIVGDTSGTWIGATNGTGIRVFFGLGCGSSVSGTAGSWASGTYYAPTGATSVVGTNGATFYITGVQLEKGSTATSFDYRPYGTELQLAQRYYQVISQSWTGIANSTTQLTSYIIHPVVMRASPSATLSSALRISDVYNASHTQSSSEVSSQYVGADATSWTFGNFTGLTQGRFYYASNASVTANGNLKLSAEL